MVDVDLVVGGTDVVIVVVSAAVMVEEVAAVDAGTGVSVPSLGSSVLETEASPLTGPARSAGSVEALTVVPERSAEAADEPHAAVPITSSTRTEICSFLTRLTLWLRQRLSPTEEGPVTA